MTSPSDPHPIGVFDSGVGGLSVLRAIRAELPAEDLLYAGDSGFAPYGDKSHEFVQQRARALTRFLLTHRAKAIVVACNTATGVAVETLRAEFAVHIIAIEPAIKPAVVRTKTGVVGVLATSGTLSSSNVTRLVSKYGGDVRVLVQACPGLADQVEKGDLGSAVTRSLVEQFVRPLIQQRADVLALGCTHYPFLSGVIQQAAGADVELIDPATAVAREVRRRLETAGLLRSVESVGREQFWTTGHVGAVARVMSDLWGSAVDVQPVEAGARSASEV